MAAYAFVILLAPAPPPFVDFPDWVYQGVLLHAILSGHPIAGYALKHYPVPNSTTTVALGLLDFAMPWYWAGKVWVCLYLALASFATWTLARALSVRNWCFIAAMPAVVFLNLNFWYGHIGFEVGACLVMLLLAMLLRGSSSVQLSAMLVLIFFTHMEACAAALLLLLLWRARSRDWIALWPALPTLALTAWYAFARFSNGNSDGLSPLQADYPYGSRPFLIYKVNTFFKTFAYVNARKLSGPSLSESIFGRPLFVFLLLASLCLAALSLVAIVRGAMRAGFSLRIFVLALLLISLLLPQAWLGVADPGSRLLLMAIAIGLFLVDWRGRPAVAIACLSALFSVMNLWQFALVERNPTMPGHAVDLPSPLLLYGHVEPETRLLYYDKLRTGTMNAPIFETALFRQVQQSPGK